MTTTAIIAVCAGLAILSFFLWATIHELSHLLMAKVLVGATLVDLKVWPHTYNGTFYWASIRYDRKREPTRLEDALIHLAPRIPGAAAAVAFPFTALLPSSWCWFVGVVVGASLFDIGNGSVAWSDGSDGKRAAEALRISAWWIRVVGWVAVITSALAWAAVMFL